MEPSINVSLLIFAFVGAVLSAEKRCPEGWSLHADSCYRVFEGKGDWYKAKRACSDNDGHLAAVTTEEENNHVKDLLTKADPDGSGKHAWIGAKSETRTGGWQWDGTSEEFQYTDWATLSRRRRFYSTQSSCVFRCSKMAGDEGWAWEEGHCYNEPEYYVCERCLLQEKCSGGSCYTLACHVDYQLDAHFHCEDQGAYLAEITSEEELNVVKELLQGADIPSYDSRYTDGGVIIGGSDYDTEGEWRWMKSGAKVDMSFGWADNEPNNSGESRRPEDCLALDKDNDFKMTDVYCSWKRPFVCERPDPQSDVVVG